MVIKSFFISGHTNAEGILRVQLDSRNADVRQGEWRFCIDSMTAYLGRNSNFPMTVSTNLVSAFEKDLANVTKLVPAKFCTLLVTGAIDTYITLIAPGKKEWLSFQNALSTFELHLRNAVNDVPTDIEVQAVVLLERLL